MKVARIFNWTLCALSCSYLLNGSCALADEGDLFNFSAGIASAYDSNLFKLPKGSLVSGQSNLADTIKSSYFVADIDKQYSLQRFQAMYQITSRRYENFKYLDFDAKEYKFSWAWALSPELTGNLFSDQKQALASFEDYRRGAVQNVVTTKNDNFDFDYYVYGPWHLIGRYNEVSNTNSQVFVQQTSYSTKNTEAGFKYLLKSGNFISFVLRNTNGTNVGQSLDFVSLRDDGFKKQTYDFNGLWILSGKSSLTAEFAYTDYQSNHFDERSFSGNYGAASYRWDALSKLSLALNLSRKIDPFVTDTSSYSVTDTLEFVPTWNISGKVNLKSNFAVSERNFEGQGPLTSNIKREDKALKYGVVATWLPTKDISTILTLQHQERDSNVNGFDFSEDTVILSAQYDL